jgi:DNA-binding CsgD family transcriptional regulator
MTLNESDMEVSEQRHGNGTWLHAKLAHEAACLADAFDCISAGMFLVDASGRIVYTNAAGRLVLAAGDPFRAACGRLAAGDRQADRLLRGLFVAADRGDDVFAIRGAAVPLTARNDERYVAHVLPLTSGARRQGGAAYAATAAVFVYKAALTIPTSPEVIAQSYELTPSELRVLLALVEVGGVLAIAETLGISETTVRFHLRQLFDKTGTHSQAELVKLVAGFASPVLRWPGFVQPRPLHLDGAISAADTSNGGGFPGNGKEVT